MYLKDPYGYKLWKHMHDEHGLTLLESELDEIIAIAKEIIDEDDSGRWNRESTLLESYASSGNSSKRPSAHGKIKSV